MSYYLIIAAFNRGVDYRTGKVKPYHWSFFIRIPPSEIPNTISSNDTVGDHGTAHQLHGMPGGFYYVGPENLNDLGALGPKCDEVDIGKVEGSRLDRFAEICRMVPIVVDEEAEWNCQDWAIEVVKRLKEEGGFVDEWITEEYIRGYLKEVQV